MTVASRVDTLKRELAKARKKHKSLADHCANEIAAKEDALRKLAVVSTSVEGVWHWQGDGEDHPESLACPVIMSAETLQELLASSVRVERVPGNRCEIEVWSDDHAHAYVPTSILEAERARTDALVAGVQNAPERLPSYIQEPLDVILKAREEGK